jgi:hypothetical protein
MAKAKKRTFEKNYVQVPNDTARAVEKKEDHSFPAISLGALGLITNLFSYPDSWELHKTELYARFAYNKETSVKRLWNELVEARFIVEYKYRIGKKWEYVYVYNIEPYTNEQINIIRQEAIEEHGKIWGLDFQDLKTETSKRRPQNPDIINTRGNKDCNKEILDKSKTRLTSKDQDQKTSLVSSEFNSIDEIIKNLLPEAPLDEIKEKLLADAEKGLVTIQTVKQYKSLLEYRLRDWDKKRKAEIESKPAQFKPKRNNRTENLPDWFSKHQEGNADENERDSVSEEERIELELELLEFKDQNAETIRLKKALESELKRLREEKRE